MSDGILRMDPEIFEPVRDLSSATYGDVPVTAVSYDWK